MTPTAAGAAFTVAAGSESVQNFNFSIVGTGTDAAQTVHSAAVVLNVVFDFALNNNTGLQTIQPGQSVTYQLDVRPLGSGNAFPGNIALSCSNLPPLSTCSFTPLQVSSGSGDTQAVVNIGTTPASESSRIAGGQGLARYTTRLGLPGLLIVVLCWPRADKPALSVVEGSVRATLVAVLAVLLVSCGGGLQGSGSGGGGGDPGTPAGSYAITLTATMNATSGVVTRTALAKLTVQ